MAEAVERMRADPDMGRLLAEGYIGPDYSLDELATYPRGSLGHAFAAVMRAGGIDPRACPERPLDTDADYCIMRLRRTHDIHLVVGGFAPTGPGNLGAMAITACQFGYPAFVLLDVAALRLCLHRARNFPWSGEFVASGTRLARVGAQPLLGKRWEEGWERPLAAWREELKLEAPPPGPHALAQALPDVEL